MENEQLTFEFAKRPTIKGFPELRWTGKRPYEFTQYYPAQLRERYGEEQNGWINKIFWGDNLQVMSHLLKEYRGQVDLIYIDPPFDSKADYKKRITIKGVGGGKAESDISSFEEKQYGDIWTNDEYIQFMYERLIIMRELLSERGSIYLHCDWHQSHHLRCILDEIYGIDNCHNVLTWKRSHAQGNAGQGAQHFGRITDTIFLYSKTADPIWNQQYQNYSDEVLRRDYKYVDEITGERYRLMPVDGPGGASKGNPYYEFLGVSGYWRYSQNTMKKLYDNGEIVLSSTGRSLSRKKYLKDAKGTPITELWDDLNRVSPTSTERLDYPTQKPECLLERIIKTSSNSGSIVFDCFMGSGTTQAVAMKLGRRFIGADINLGAIQTTTKRLINVTKALKPKKNQQLTLMDGGKKSVTYNVVEPTHSMVEESPAGYYATESNSVSNTQFNHESTDTESSADDVKYTGFEVYNVNNYDFFRNPVEARDLIIEALEIQPYPQSHVWNGELDGRMVKIMPVNHIATKADLEELKANLPYHAYEKRKEESPNQPVERITIVCMGHEPDLKASLEQELSDYKLDIEIVDILRDKKELQLKREAEAEITREGDKLVIRSFYPMNLLQKLSLQKEYVEDWRQLVESIMIDWNYDGVVMQPSVTDVPGKKELVEGIYDIPKDAGTIKVKITDLLSESLEMEVE
jgi:DNA modification methylase